MRAIILAAGKGTRLAPVTDEIPKPLVKVNGRRIIETQIEALLAAGIEDITIIRGYLKDKFAVLLEKYPKLKFIDNPYFETANNISSIVTAGELVRDAYIVEGDLLIRNPAIIEPKPARTNYLTVPVKEVNDWCFFPDETGKILKMATSGRDCAQMVGISYWTDADGARLAKHAAELFSKDYGKEKYWDEIALDEYLEEYDIYVRSCRREEVLEIDTLQELQALDDSYLKWGNAK